MSFFPQIGSGSVCQFPVQRSRYWRAITNSLESGERIMLPDTYGGLVGWELSYRDLNNTEVQNLSALFMASQGQYGSFTFIDPLANLLGWSETLSQTSWQAGLLQITSGVNDPLGTQRASAVSNGSPGVQALTQSLGISGDYVACLSAWLRSNTPGNVILQRDGLQKIVPAGAQWGRFFISGKGTAGAQQSTFSLNIAAGQTIDVWGLQVEAQPAPSTYKSTGAAMGIYEETYFGSDSLTVHNTAPGLSSCNLKLVSRVSGN